MADRVIIKRASLDGLLEGFDSECFAYVKPATVQDKMEFRQAIKAIQDSTDDIEDEWQQKFVDDHFVSGKVKALSPEGEFELVDMTTDHLDISDISDQLFLTIMGIDIDPKALSAAAARNSTQQPSENSTATPSSETSGTTSATT